VDSDDDIAIDEGDDGENEEANSPMLSMSVVAAIGAMREGHGDPAGKWGERAGKRRDRADMVLTSLDHALELPPLVYRRADTDDGLDKDRIAQVRLIAIGAAVPSPLWSLRTLVTTLGVILTAKRESARAGAMGLVGSPHGTGSHLSTKARITGHVGGDPGLASFVLHFFFRSCSSADIALEHISSLVRGLYHWGGIKGPDRPGNTQPQGPGAGHPRVKTFAKLVGCIQGPNPDPAAPREATQCLLMGLDAVLDGEALPKPDKGDERTRVCQAAAFRGNKAAFPGLPPEEYARMEGLLLREATGRLDGQVDLDLVLEAWLKRWKRQARWTLRFLSSYFSAMDVSFKGRIKFDELCMACGQLSPSVALPTTTLLDMYTRISECSGWGECATAQTFMTVLAREGVLSATTPPPPNLAPPCEGQEDLLTHLRRYRHVGESEEDAIETLVTLVPKPIGRRLLDKRAHFFTLYDAAEAEVERRRLCAVTGHSEGEVDASKSSQEAYKDPIAAWLAYRLFDDAVTQASVQRERLEERRRIVAEGRAGRAAVR